MCTTWIREREGKSVVVVVVVRTRSSTLGVSISLVVVVIIIVMTRTSAVMVSVLLEKSGTYGLACVPKVYSLHVYNIYLYVCVCIQICLLEGAAQQ